LKAVVSNTTPTGVVLVGQPDSVKYPTANGTVTTAVPRYRIDLQTAGVALQPGGTYQLKVSNVPGDEITGTTTIPTATPGAAPTLTPFSQATDTLRLSWSAVPGAWTYEVQVWRANGNPFPGQEQSGNLTHSVFADTSVVIGGRAKAIDSDDIFPWHSTTSVYVYAVDRNYYEYYRLLGDPLSGSAPSRLSGGLGVFASAVPIVLRKLDIR
jgi:hypothetical protein